MTVVGLLIYYVLIIFVFFLWVRFVMDVVQMFARDWTPRGGVLVALEGVYSLTDPPIKAVRRVVPPLRLGSISLDLAFIIVLLSCYLLIRVNSAVFF